MGIPVATIVSAIRASTNSPPAAHAYRSQRLVTAVPGVTVVVAMGPDVATRASRSYGRRAFIAENRARPVLSRDPIQEIGRAEALTSLRCVSIPRCRERCLSTAGNAARR